MKHWNKLTILAAVSCLLVAGCASGDKTASNETSGTTGTTPTTGTTGSESPTTSGEKPTSEGGTTGSDVKPTEGATTGTSKPNEKPVTDPKVDPSKMTKGPSADEAANAPTATDTGGIVKPTEKPGVRGPGSNPANPGNARPNNGPARETPNDRLLKTADASIAQSTYVGTWSFAMDPARAKVLLSKLNQGGSTGKLFVPNYSITIAPDGKFTAHEQFMSFDRNVVGTYQYMKGALKLTISTVNGKPPIFKDDKEGWVLVYHKDKGTVERGDTLKLSKKS